MLLLLSYALQGIGSRNGNLLLNAPDALFLLGSQIKTSVQGIRAASVDFDKLLLIEDLLFGNEAGADGEVLLGTCIIFLKVIALVETCAVKAPVPCDELDAKPGGMGSQHGSVEVSQQTVVTGQALACRGGACSSSVMYSRTVQARSVARSQARSRSGIATSSCQ